MLRPEVIQAIITEMRANPNITHASQKLNLSRDAIRKYWLKAQKDGRADKPAETGANFIHEVGTTAPPAISTFTSTGSSLGFYGLPPQTGPVTFARRRYTSGAFISDVHYPYHDKAAIQVTMESIQDQKPDMIILGGDILDCYLLSRFNHSPSRQHTLMDEIDSAREFFLWIDAIVRRVIFITGNHEVRINSLIRNHPALFNHPDLTLPKLAKLPAHWEYVANQGHVKLGEMNFMHGDEKGGEYFGKYPARRILERWQRNFIFGHIHRFDSAWGRTYDGQTIEVHSNGHLSDETSAAVEYISRPAWQKGYTWFDICEEVGGPFEISQRVVRNKQLLAAGRQYAAPDFI